MTSRTGAISPELEALFLCTRFVLNSQQTDRLEDLLSGLNSFDRLVELADSSFLAPLFYRHVKRVKAGSCLGALLSALRPLTLPFVAHHLNVSAAQRRFASEVFRDGGLDYAFFKGNALAAKFYPDPSVRYCRDIDVLVPEDQAVAAALRAQELGYEVYPDVGQMSARDLRAVMRYEPEIQLTSPEGVLIEIHHRIDRTGRYFNTQDLLSRAEEVDLGGVSARILPTPEHFLYLCLHHTRHRWSRLHWMLDLNCILAHRDHNEHALAAVARSRRLGTTLDSCIEFVQACGESAPFSRVEAGTPAWDLMVDCVQTIEGGVEVEKSLKQTRATPDCAYPWQVSNSERLFYAVSKRFSWLRPKYHHYARFPLPLGWHWVYFFMPLLSAIRRRLGSGVSGKEPD